jgi:hypothetical protein
VAKKPASSGAARPESPESRESRESRESPEIGAPPDSPGSALVRRHLAFGWWSLAVFTTLGLVLEAAHGLKLGWYLDVPSATRRLSFTLAHAHGTLLGLVNIAFAVSLGHARLSAATAARASFALRAVTILLPLGFLLGGVAFYAGDPGFAIVLVPPSGALLVVALVMVARAFSSRPRSR